MSSERTREVIIIGGGPAGLSAAIYLGRSADPTPSHPFRAHHDGQLTALTFEQGESVNVEGAFTTRGDVIHNDLAESAGAKLDEDGQVVVDHCLQTTVPGLYAADV